jgi:hypothetical protein
LDSSSAMTLIMYILRLSGADPGFQVSREGGALKWFFFGGISWHHNITSDKLSDQNNERFYHVKQTVENG